jgi:hypothetical protein
MKTIAAINGVIYIIVSALTIFRGADPKKWQIWLVTIYSFMTFFLVGIAGTGSFYEAVKIAILAALVFSFVGITTFWNRERAKKWLKEHGQSDE